MLRLMGVSLHKSLLTLMHCTTTTIQCDICTCVHLCYAVIYIIGTVNLMCFADTNS